MSDTKEKLNGGWIIYKDGEGWTAYNLQERERILFPNRSFEECLEDFREATDITYFS